MFFGNFQMKHLRYLVYSPGFKSARLGSEQVPNERTKGYK